MPTKANYNQFNNPYTTYGNEKQFRKSTRFN